MEGTITWFAITEGHYPPLSTGYCSDDVLLWASGMHPTVGSWWPEAAHWSHRSGNWTPTHFAYINYPTD